MVEETPQGSQNPFEKSPLERVARRLYARNASVRLHPRRSLREHQTRTRTDWETAGTHERINLDPDHFKEERERLKEVAQLSRKETFRLTEGLLLAAAIFFVGAVAVAAWFFVSDSSMISARNISINISGPLAVAGGDELPLQIEVVNRNSIPLILSDLVITYPEGTRTAGNLSAPMREQRISLGTIPSGGHTVQVARAALFGPEQTQADITVTLEYRIESSNAVFSKEGGYSVKLTSAPLRVEVKTLTEISSEQELPIAVTVTSNAAAPMKRVMLEAEYPFGFSPKSFDPIPTVGTTRWLIGDLAPGESRTITISGAVTGSQSDQRIFKFRAGSVNDTNELIAAFSKAEAPVLIKKPFVALRLDLGLPSQNGFSVARRAIPVVGQLFWQNTLPHELYDMELSVELSGVIDKKAVQAQDGFYNSTDGTVRWTEQTKRDFTVVEPGESSRVSFSFASLPWSPVAPPVNPSITLTLHVRAKRIAENKVPETLEYSEVQTVRLASNPIFNADSLYSAGPFTNEGPFPPQSEQRTTYTIHLGVHNDTSDLHSGYVTARLPLYVEWLGMVSPENAISYNPSTREMRWDIGAVPRGAGYGKTAPEVYFQVALTPSVSQQSQTPTLLDTQMFQAVDRFTGVMLQTTHDAITTNLIGDPVYGKVGGTVRE